jgi:hypothetical protein
MIQVITKYGAIKAPAPASSSAVWGAITGTVTAQTDLTGYISSNYYPLSNPSSYISGITSGMVTTALGYTPEDVANKQNSLAVDGTATKYPTVDAVNAGLATKGAGTILGTLPATNGLLPIASGTANTVTTSAEWSINAARTKVKLGSGAMVYTDRGIDIYQNYAGRVGVSITNPSTTGLFQLLFAQDTSKYGGFLRFNSAYSGNYSGSSFPLADSFQVQSGAGNDKPFVVSASPFVVMTGVASTNVATRHDATGWRQGTIADVHTANTVPFEVSGKAKFNSTIRLKGYTVATLPTGVEGDTAYITDGLLPTYLGTATGGGAVKCKVFFNGVNWIT